MDLPTRGEGRPLKYGLPTRTYSFKFPVEIIEKIRREKIDAGQILFDVIGKGMNPYRQEDSNKLLRKIVRIFVLEKINASKYEKDFTAEELQHIISLAKEVSRH